jgi:uncharacterized protein (TIGR02679 family)
LSRDPVELALNWDGLDSLGPVWEELARRMGASDRPVRRFSVNGLDTRGRRKLASLLGLQRVPEHDVVTLDAGKVASALGLGGEAELRRLVEGVQGPIGNRAADRVASAQARAAMWAALHERLGTRVPNTLARIRTAGIPGGDIDAHARVLDVFARCMESLPSSSPVPLPMLAWRISGDPHTLDWDTACGRYLQFAAVELAGGSTVELDGISVRSALRQLGVIVDRLCSTTLTYGLQALVDSPVGRALEAGLATKMPVNLSGIMLDGAVPHFSQRSWLCVENPSVVEAAVAAGSVGPVVCTSGWPSADTQRILDLARAQGIELLYAGDYDSAGLAIANYMATRYGARILMTESLYLAADLARAPAWGDSPVPSTPWDQGLAAALRVKRRVVYQEDPAIWRELIATGTQA